MWTIKKKIWYALYLILAAWLPESSHSELARKWRAFFAKHIARQCGSRVNIERKARFSPALSIGDHSGIGINCCVYGPVSIGKNVMMGQDVIVYTTRHRDDRTDIPMCEQGMSEVKPVMIGDDVWIGGRAIILPGVHIGDGCIIGAGAVVSRDIPAYSVAVGCPARVVRSRCGS